MLFLNFFLYVRYACFHVISVPISIISITCGHVMMMTQPHQQANDPENYCLIARREDGTAFSKNNPWHHVAAM